jgi:cytidyltransferase-like protein
MKAKKKTIKKKTTSAKATAVKPVIVAVSGGFDPLHVGHARMFQKAKALGDKLVVILNNDNWLKLKKMSIAISGWMQKKRLHMAWQTTLLQNRCKTC